VELKKRYTVEVSAKLCKSCGYCQEVCPKNVFALSGKLDGQGYDSMAAPAAEQCIGCGSCVMSCPDFAISVTERS
jgi:2-oxoglutarate ferredoxin oxidoreductase subunit delta